MLLITVWWHVNTQGPLRIWSFCLICMQPCFCPQHYLDWAGCCVSLIPALCRWRWQHQKFRWFTALENLKQHRVQWEPVFKKKKEKEALYRVYFVLQSGRCRHVQKGTETGARRLVYHIAAASFFFLSNYEIYLL